MTAFNDWYQYSAYGHMGICPGAMRAAWKAAREYQREKDIKALKKCHGRFRSKQSLDLAIGYIKSLKIDD